MIKGVIAFPSIGPFPCSHCHTAACIGTISLSIFFTFKKQLSMNVYFTVIIIQCIKSNEVKYHYSPLSSHSQ